MYRFDQKTILVVGANGAFGNEFCDQLMSKGAKVIGTARSVESSSRLRADLTERLLLDLEDDQSIDRLTSYLQSQARPLDGIVLAAGLVAFGSVTDTPMTVVDKLMRVNALGQIQTVSRLTSKLVDAANLGTEPFVISISGVIAEKPLPNLAAYSASKTALHGYSIAAGKELRKLGIRWIDARPGHTETGLAGRSIFGVAPNFGQGMVPASIVARMIQGLEEDATDLPSEVFA